MLQTEFLFFPNTVFLLMYQLQLWPERILVGGRFDGGNSCTKGMTCKL